MESEIEIERVCSGLGALVCGPQAAGGDMAVFLGSIGCAHVPLDLVSSEQLWPEERAPASLWNAPNESVFGARERHSLVALT